MSNKTLQDFNSHQTCRLGQWYYQGDDEHLFSNISGFVELEKPHQSVHQCGIDAIGYYNENNKDQTLYALKNMEDASLSVLEKLEKTAQVAECRV